MSGTVCVWGGGMKKRTAKTEAFDEVESGMFDKEAGCVDIGFQGIPSCPGNTPQASQYTWS